MAFYKVCEEMTKFEDKAGAKNLLKTVALTFYNVTKDLVSPSFNNIIGIKLNPPKNENEKFTFTIVGLAVNFDKFNLANSGIDKKKVCYVFDDFTCQLKQEEAALLNEGLGKIVKTTKLDKKWRDFLSIYALDNEVLTQIYNKEKDEYIDMLLDNGGKEDKLRKD